MIKSIIYYVLEAVKLPTLEKNKHLLFISFFLLLPFGQLYVYYCLLLFLLSLITITNHEYKTNYFSFFFILLFIPVIISLVNAVNFERSFFKALSLIPILIIGIFLSSNLTSKKIYYAMSILVAMTGVWCFDFIFYHFRFLDFEHALLWRWSFKINSDYYIPILGQILSVILPIVFESLRRYADNKIKISISCIFSIIYLVTIIYSGNRNAVIMMLFSLLLWLTFIVVRHNYHKIYPMRIILSGIFLLIILSTALSVNPGRFNSFINMESRDIQLIDNLSSNRLSLWESAFEMAKDNWIIGIGPRGFRYAYDNYRPEEGKYAVEYEHGSTHPHFALLEILLETGIIGLFSLFFLFWIIFKSILKVNHDNQLILVPWFIALITAIVPNIGKAFYSSYWLTLILFLLIGCASIMNIDEELKLKK